MDERLITAHPDEYLTGQWDGYTAAAAGRRRRPPRGTGSRDQRAAYWLGYRAGYGAYTPKNT